jgi:hypothetical protein
VSVTQWFDFKDGNRKPSSGERTAETGGGLRRQSRPIWLGGEAHVKHQVGVHVGNATGWVPSAIENLGGLGGWAFLSGVKSYHPAVGHRQKPLQSRDFLP